MSNGDNKDMPTETQTNYKSQAAREAQAANYGDAKYWQCLDDSAQRAYAYFMSIGDEVSADSMFTRSLADALRGNDGI